MSLRGFSDAAAVWITERMSTMGCALLLLVWAVLPLPFPWSTNVVAYVSQDVIQLVALSIIMVGTKVSERAVREQANQDHTMLMTELALLTDLAKQQAEEIAALHRVTTKVSEIHAVIVGSK